MSSDPAALSRGRRLPLLVASAWGGAAFGLATLVTVIAWRTVPAAPITVPGRGGVEWQIWPMVPLVGAVPLCRVVSVTTRPVERAAARGGGIALAGVAVLATLALTASVIAASAFPTTMVVRNTLLIQGLTLTAAGCGPAELAWAPAFVAATGMWMLGTGPGRVADWAILFVPPDRLGPWAAGLAVTALGATLVARRVLHRR